MASPLPPRVFLYCSGMRLGVKSDWSSRGYLPDYDPPGGRQHIIFRLADSLPSRVMDGIRAAPAVHRLAAAESSLDAGYGSRALADARVASIVSDALAHFDGERYRLLAWCIMPNHVHLLVERFPSWPIAIHVRTWKSFSARRANGLIGAAGALWARDYFDRAMRTDDQTERTSVYIETNPVAAGLCAHPEDWPWSSAHLRSAGLQAGIGDLTRFPERQRFLKGRQPAWRPAVRT